MNKTLLISSDNPTRECVVSAGYCYFDGSGKEEYVSPSARDFRIIYVLRGSLSFSRENQDVLRASAGELVYLTPDSRDTTRCTSDCRDFWVSFKGFEDELCELGLSGTDAFCTRLDTSRDLIRSYFEDIISELQLKESGYKGAAKLGFLKILLLLRREKLSENVTRGMEKRKIAPALLIMNNEFSKTYSMDFYAKCCNMSKSSFLHKFSRIMQTTPIKYLNDIKMKNSVALLLETDMPISEIASALGFSSPRYFSRMFFTYYGARPTDYRKKNFGQER